MPNAVKKKRGWKIALVTLLLVVAGAAAVHFTGVYTLPYLPEIA